MIPTTYYTKIQSPLQNGDFTVKVFDKTIRVNQQRYLQFCEGALKFHLDEGSSITEGLFSSEKQEEFDLYFKFINEELSRFADYAKLVEFADEYSQEKVINEVDAILASYLKFDDEIERILDFLIESEWVDSVHLPNFFQSLDRKDVKGAVQKLGAALWGKFWAAANKWSCNDLKNTCEACECIHKDSDDPMLVVYRIQYAPEYKVSSDLVEKALRNCGQHVTSLSLKKSRVNTATIAVFASYCPNLRSLDLVDSQIRDLHCMSAFTQLQELDLSDNLFQDISPLAHLTGLKGLSLDNITIHDMSPMSKLTNLVFLSLNFATVNDFSPLTKLTNLTEIDVRDVSGNYEDIKRQMPRVNFNWFV